MKIQVQPELGRRKIDLAEKQMPGIMALRKRWGEEKPLQGARIAGCLHMTVQTAVFIETLLALGASVRWMSCNVLSTQDDVAAACKQKGIPIFSWKRMSEEEYKTSLAQVIDFAGKPPDLLVDDGGDLIEYVYSTRPELINTIRGVSEQTTTGIRRLKEKQRQGILQTPCIDVNGSLTKRKFDNRYGCRESLLDGIRRATDLMIGGKTAVVMGYGDVGKGCVQAFSGAHARVLIVEVNPIRALQAAMEGYEVTTPEKAAPQGDFFVTATGCIEVIREEHLLEMKEGAVLCNIGHFDREIDVACLQNEKNWKKIAVQEDVEQFTSTKTGKSLFLLAQGKLVNLACATGHPSFIMSLSFSNQLFAVHTLWNNPPPPGIHRLPQQLDEEVARLHLPALGAELSNLSEKQKRYLNE